MNYHQIKTAPAIFFSNDPDTMYRIIKKCGEIENKAALNGYCVSIGTGKKGLQWIIGNNNNGSIEIYWSKVDFESAKNIEIIANVLKKRNGRDPDKILTEAHQIIEKMTKWPKLQDMMKRFSKNDSVINTSFDFVVAGCLK